MLPVLALSLFISASLQSDDSRDYNVTARKFNLDCGGIFTQKQFVVDSPGYPSGYEANLDCAFLLRGEFCRTYFNFQFLDFDVEKSLGCTKDRLEIENTDALCGTIVGIRNYYSPQGTLQLKFLSDGEIQGRGFRILVTRLPCDYDPNNMPGYNPADIYPQSEPTTEPSIYRHNHNLCPNGYQPHFPNGQNYPSRPNYPVNPTYPIFPSYPAYPNQPNNPSYPTYPTPNPQYLPSYPSQASLPFCCANSYNSKRFIISSPGFPYSNTQQTDCVYHIYKANRDICRLRMHFLFFWNGEQEFAGCNKGFLQIDGKFFCGCRVGLKLISSFDNRWGDTPKVIRYRNEGYPRTVFSGFAIEVIQDECPRRYTPINTTDDGYHYYNDQVNRVSWPNLTHNNTLEKAHSIGKNTEIFDENSIKNNNKNEDAAMVKHIYFYQDPNDNNLLNKNIEPRDIEETTYVDTSNTNPFLPNGHDNTKCRMWGILQWTLLAKEALWQKMPKCNSNIPVKQKCFELNWVKGYIQSPGYPKYYPRNLNLCYRFVKQPGYCSIKLQMTDFDVEVSHQCNKDYLLLGQKYRYCGRSLQNAHSTFDLSYKNYEDVYFITDNKVCTRGFRGLYEQIPCSYPVPPVMPMEPTIPPYVPPTTPSPINPIPCGRTVNEEYFVLEVYGYHQSTCHFNVVKNNEDVCAVNINFDYFDLQCNYEYLLINNKQYCGQRTGQTISFDLDDDQLPIVYRKQTNAIVNLEALRFRINGMQISTNCGPDLEVSPERHSKFNLSKAINFRTLNNKNSTEIVKRTEEDYEIILRSSYKEICGIIMKLPITYQDDDICKILLKNRQNHDCIPLSGRTLYVPTNASDKIGFKLNDVDLVNNITVTEVICQ